MLTKPQENALDDDSAEPVKAPDASRSPIVITMAPAVDKEGREVIRWQATWPEQEDVLALDLDILASAGIGFGPTPLDAEADLAAWTLYCLPLSHDATVVLGTLATRLEVLTLAAAKTRRVIDGARRSASPMNGVEGVNLDHVIERWRATLAKLTGLLGSLAATQPAEPPSGG